jgi:hypothetical protein
MASSEGREQLMHKCSKCLATYTGVHCPGCGAARPMSIKEINKAISKPQYLLLGALFGIIAANHFYPTLDRNTIFGIALALFFLPMILHIVSGFRKRLAVDVDLLKIAYLYCASGLALLAIVLALNAVTDFASPTVVHSRIVGKRISRGRYSTTHHLIVQSWRPNRDTEDLAVSSNTYSQASVDQALSVDVHTGFFHLPWYGNVSLDRSE